MKLAKRPKIPNTVKKLPKLRVKTWQHEDTWVPFDGVLARPSTDVEFNPNLKVRDLIFDAPNEWNIAQIKSLFSDAAATLILSIPLSYTPIKDSRMWWPTRDDIFSVKFAYWLGKLGLIDARQNHYVSLDEGWRQRLWKLNIIPKINSSHGELVGNS